MHNLAPTLTVPCLTHGAKEKPPVTLGTHRGGFMGFWPVTCCLCIPVVIRRTAPALVKWLQRYPEAHWCPCGMSRCCASLFAIALQALSSAGIGPAS